MGWKILFGTFDSYEKLSNISYIFLNSCDEERQQKETTNKESVS